MPLNAEKTDPLVQLHRVRLKVVEKRWMVYVGTEDIWKRKTASPIRRTSCRPINRRRR
jgi:hypothetical protein